MTNLANIAQRQVNKLRCYTASHHCNFDPKENLIIFSDPRGGSTWITEIISQMPGTVVLWEPLHLRWVQRFRDLGFGYRQYIPEATTWRAAEEAFDQVFRGKLLNTWTCNTPKDFLEAERMVVKFCRANAMMPWLVKTFDFTYDPIFLIRHPFAVVASQMKHGSWDFDITGYTIPCGPFRALYEEHEDFLATIKTKPEALLATWCIANNVPLKSPMNDKKWITVHYENLLMQPEEEIGRIFDRWNLPIPEGAFAQITEASSTTKEPTFDDSLEAQLSKWKSSFGADDLARMTAMLDYFGIEAYSADVFPRAIAA